MTLKYKVIKQKTPASTGEVRDIYYARACDRKMYDLDMVAKQLAKESTLSPADIYATLVGLTDLIPLLLMDNNSVSLGSLGIFSLHFSSEVKNSKEEVNKRCIKGIKMKFRASPKLKKRLRSPIFEKSKNK
ncbi:hypothetical protein [Carboxylicivirga caseinilyticus]|uniref:HU family DNA-binding protein n=1 Tax=Carboxylicivirga caseinilyticus TaxID=3417572 RepID=UPI003D34D415